MEQDKSAPLVSVIVPAFNAEATLGATLRSAAAQTYANIEILIVDDGSRDATARIAADFCAQESRATLIRQENKGVAAARNAAIAASQGAYIAPLDADDLWHPAKVTRQMAVAAAAPSPLGFVYCWSRTIDMEDRVLPGEAPPEVRGRAAARLLFRNVVGNGSAPLFERAALLEAGGYEERLRAQGAEGTDDFLIQLQIAARHPIDVVPEYLVGYRMRPHSLSANAERMFRSWSIAAAMFAEKEPAFEQAWRWSRGYYALLLAEARALRGAWSGAARMLAEAAAADPAWTSAYLAYRAARTVNRKLGAPPPAAPIPFAEWDPTVPSPPDPHRIASWANRLARIERTRMAQLARAEDTPGALKDAGGSARAAATHAA
jgi:glycosyltransferase involved in cell wall biosynthesis